MVALGLRWRYFWSRRSRRRTALALTLAVVALLALIYLALSPDGQRQVVAGLFSVFQGVSSLGLIPVLVMCVALCAALSVALIVVPSYRRHSYLATAPTIIPPVSVYLDAENQLPAAAIRPFTEFLMKHLDGRRADLLYFLDAARTANGEKYKTLYRFGFRPVDVPHDPTGKGEVKEAVDRELAMHAYERAILGPPEQEFIIVTGDRDFVPLIYRLAALGHRVQIWAAPVHESYRVVETYLGVNVIDLSHVISELRVASPDGAPATERRSAHLARPAPPPKPSSVPRRVPAPTVALQAGEEHLYFAVAETLAAYDAALAGPRSDSSRNGRFHALMRGTYGPRLAGVGYSVGNWLDFWLEHLIALNVLVRVGGQAFPKRGSSNAEDAARSLFAMSKAATRAALRIGAEHDDGLVRMSEISAALANDPSLFDERAAPLFKLLAVENGTRIAPVRYFVRSARALDLLEFDDVPDSLDLIAHPRLPAVDNGATGTTAQGELGDAAQAKQTQLDDASIHDVQIQSLSHPAATESPSDESADQN
jgi:NYN domain